MLRKIVLPLLLVIASLAGAAFMFATRPEVEVVEAEVLPPLVRVITVAPRDLRLDVYSQGTVLPRTEADLVAEVAGRIVAVAPSFEAGGFFERGEVLVRIDDREYQLDRAAAAAQVAQARVRVAREEAEAAVAAEEWRELGAGGEPSALVLRQPQLDEARALLLAAEATLARVDLDLDRTRIQAPWSGRVREKVADVGQFVSRGTTLGRLHAVDHAEVRLPVPYEELRFLDPAVAAVGRSESPGPEVVLEADFAGERHRWTGYVVRAEGELDAKSRMMSLVARVDDPYGRRRASAAESAPPLAIGLFVEATVEGRTVPGVAEVPRSALRGDHQVLVVDGESRLRLREVEVLRRGRDTAVIAAGLAAGERVCVSPLDAPVDGMTVRVVEDGGALDGASAPAARANESPSTAIGSPSAGR